MTRWRALPLAAMVLAGCDTVMTLPELDRPVSTTPPEVPEVPAGFEQPAPHARAIRLTLAQWENTVQDLLRLPEPTGFSSELPQDALPAGFLFDNPADTLGVDQTQQEGFARAAARVAEHVVTDPARLAAILSDGAADTGRSLDERGASLIAALVPRAFRVLPDDVDAEDIAALQALFVTGQTAYDEHLDDPFVGGVRLLLEGLLQSPRFLYRFELEPTDGQLARVSATTMASRLSYALWNTMPDDALFAAAGDGSLDDDAGLEREARRLLASPRAKAQLERIFEAVLEAKKLDDVRPSPELFGDAPVDLGRLAREENRRFIAAILDEGGSYTDLLTSTSTFVSADTAPLYGLEGAFGAEFVRTELDPSTRRGIFTHLGFLSQFATSSDPDPIHRGVFLAKNILCHPLSAPPDAIPPLPPAEAQESNRQLVERHTQQPGTSCNACHATYINPLGFPFENYDAVGRVRADDRGLPLDTATSPLLDEVVSVAGAVDLADQLAASRAAHVCLAKHFIEASLGRANHLEDDVWTARLGEASRDGDSLEEVLVSLFLSPGFRLRSPVELAVEGQP